jgi:hypothetical protein
MKSNLTEAPRSYLYFVSRKQGRVNRIDQNTDEFKQRKKQNSSAQERLCLLDLPRVGHPTIDPHLRHCRYGGARTGWRATDVRMAAIR